MTSDIQWLEIAEKVATLVFPVGSFLLGTIVKRGVDSSKLSSLVTRMGKVEDKLQEHSLTISGHTQLLETLDKLETKIDANNNLAQRIAGKLGVT